MFERKALTCAAFCTFAAIPAQAQNIAHHPVAEVCLRDGRCLEIPMELEFLAYEDCAAAIPQLYSMLVQQFMLQGLTRYILSVDVTCEASGVDA